MSCNCKDKININEKINNFDEIIIKTKYCADCKFNNRIKNLAINVDLPKINFSGCAKTISVLEINKVKVEKIIGNKKVIDIIFNGINCLEYREFLKSLSKSSILTFNNCFLDKDFYNFMNELDYIRLGNVFVPKVYD